MKAIVVREFGGPDVMRVEEVAAPLAERGQIVVRVEAAGVNPVDTYIRSGMYPAKPKLPYTPGSDAAGVVAEVNGTERFKPGDRVYIGGSVTGSYAELALCNTAQVFPLPEKVSFSQGAAVNVPYATAYRALIQLAEARAGEVVLIHGATGGVGLASVQLARSAGVTIIATGGTEEGRRLVLEQGAHYVLDHRAPGYLDEVISLTSGSGVNVVLEMLANNNLGKDLGVLAMRGRVVIIGSRGTVEIDPRAAMMRDARMIGMSMYNASPSELANIHAALGAGLDNGTLRPVVAQEVPLEETARAHGIVMELGARGKIVLIP